MPGTPETPSPRPRSGPTNALLRRRSTPPVPAGSSSPLWRRALNYLLVFATAVLFADALVGERGLVATTRARRAADGLSDQVERLRRDNQRLRDAAKQLRENPSTIESLAREELGLIRPGEILVVLKDRKPAGN